MHKRNFTFIMMIRCNKLWLVEKCILKCTKHFMSAYCQSHVKDFAIYVLINVLINVQIQKKKKKKKKKKKT